MDLVSQTLEVEMLFNKKPDHGTEFDCLGDNAARSSNGFVPFNPASQSLNVHAEALRQRSGAPARSVIDAWLTMKGNLESEGDIQVDGKVQGHIRCTQLIVNKDATIDGDVLAAEVIIRGKVKGVIRANRVKLQETACVESEIFFEKSLGIEDGASFEGQIRRASEPLIVSAPKDRSARPGEPVNEATRAATAAAETDAKIAPKSQPRREPEVRAPVAKSA
jgi:cytoskeletal protein CcmA (bactofilin family)